VIETFVMGVICWALAVAVGAAIALVLGRMVTGRWFWP
jgi:hypothetical protein